ncbi:zinc finger protein, putative [Plasmodium ovale]|uniref:Zinc finger protein, putative n=3 Tax=Plasmodium ovale TaxID=36330 RepID=A0A1A8X1T3_PLAOA|nr:zinc finger protein, putative [Plasmodium ovale curtisi]SBS97673.1 zinc finger protein, putative [Plasmodium ovale curtisi]SBT78907.1 zinc finger protein, putative [Plasmodium ovale]SCP06252.1 zinc finger protein, putative [Plasmodium ovale]
MGRKRIDKNTKNVKKRKRKKGSDSEDDDDIEITNTNVNLNRNVSVSCKFKQREKVDINLILAQDEADASKMKSYCWTKVSGGNSSLARRKFCIVCGFEGKYKCLKCYEHKPVSYIRYYCSLNCKKIHDESSCCKSKMLDIW